MNISPKGLALIKKSEGFRNITYQDVVGAWTIGYGHRIIHNESFPEGITEGQGEVILLQDIEHVEIYLNAACPGLFQNEFDALCDFGFNLGTGAIHQLLSHGLDNVTTEILKWNHAGGKVVSGLTTRREAEKVLWDLDEGSRKDAL